MASYYEKNAGENLPIIYTKKVFLDKGNFRICIDSADGSQIRLHSPSGSIKLSDDGNVYISSNSTIFNNPISGTSLKLTQGMRVNGASYFNNDVVVSGQSFFSGALNLDGRNIKIRCPADGAFANAAAAEGAVFAAGTVPSCATGYIKIRIGNYVGVLPMYSASRLII